MTAQELLSAALALFFETDGTAYAGTALRHINMVLAESWRTNNRLRRQAGKSELAQAPVLTSLDETLPYEDQLTRMALPYGLAAKLYFDEEDNARLNYFLQEYASRLDACDRWVVAF